MSSESEDESSEEQEEKSAPSTRSVQHGAKVGAKAVAKAPPRRNARRIEESEDESEEASESDESGTSREWDEYCFVCQDGGNVICCDGCTNVAHLSCLKMKAHPTGEWHCKDCLTKLQMQH